MNLWTCAAATLCSLLAVMSAFAENTPAVRQVHWLVGVWEGELKSVPAPQGRFVEVWAVAGDGKASGVMGKAGEEQPGKTEVTVMGPRVRIVNAVQSVVELVREGDDRLVGTIVGKDGGRAQPFALTKRPESPDSRILGRQLIGTWEGSVWFVQITSENPRRLLHIYYVGQNGDQWVAEGRFGYPGRPLKRINIEVVVDKIGNDPWITFATPDVRPWIARLQLMHGKHLMGHIKRPGTGWGLPQHVEPPLNLERVD